MQRAPSALLDDLDAIVWEMDPATWRFTYVSAGAERLLGYPAGQWVAEPDFWRTHLHPEDRDGAIAFCESCVLRGCDHEMEYRMLARDDRIVWLRDLVHVIPEPGQPTLVHGVMIDITAQKTLELRLRASEERFARFSDASIDGLAIHAQGRMLDVNGTLARMLGYTPEELIGRSPAELTIPEERAMLASHIMSGSEAPIEGHALTKGGSVFPVELRARNITHGETAARLVIVRDISDRRLAERAVRESEATLRLVLQQIPALVWTTDRELRNTSILGRGLAHVGIDPSAFVGRSLVELMPDDHERAQVLAAHRAALEGRSAAFGTSWLGVRWESHVEPLRDADGAIQGVLGMGIDVTEQFRLASALAESEARYRTLVEDMPDAVMVSVNDRIVFVNRAGLTMVGAAHASEVVGRTLYDFVHADSVAEVQARLLALEHPGNQLRAARRRVQRLDGEAVDVEVTSTTLKYGSEQAVQAVFRDVSERQRSEAALRDAELRLQQSQKLEAVGRLAGGIAHDFNNLLTVITVYTQLAVESMPPTDPRAADLREVQQAARRAADLTRQLLAFSRKQVMQPTVLDLNLVVHDVQKMLRRVIGEDVRLATLPSPREATIRADRNQLEQVLMNLVVNARDAMPDGGRLTIATRVLAEGEAPLPGDADIERPAGPMVRLDVSDTGIGMEAAVRERVFEPFFTTKPMGRGTGLGLSTVYGIVKQTGGFVTVDSTPGRGTTFSLFFPLVDSPLLDGSPVPAPALPSGSETILLVEDEHAVREAAQRILSECGYLVLVASDGSDALALAREHRGRISLLLTDLVMPDMGGRELVARVADIDPAIRVMYMSGYTDEQILERRSPDEPDAELILKPFAIEVLATRVRAALDRRRA
jgi:PAS domain S-box-containing protein